MPTGPVNANPPIPAHPLAHSLDRLTGLGGSLAGKVPAVSVAPHRRIVRRGLAVLGASIRLEPRSFTVAVVGAGLYGAMTVGSAVVFGHITDEVILPSFASGQFDRAALWRATALIFGVVALKALGVVLRRTAATLMQMRLEATHRKAVSARYQRLPLSWHQQHSTGELLSNVHADVQAAFSAIAPLPMSVGVLIMLAIAAVVMVLTDPFMALVGLALGIATARLNWSYNHRLAGPAVAVQALRSDVSHVAHESFDGALVVKTLGREAAETERFAASSHRLRDQLVRIGRLRAGFDPVMEALPGFGILAVLGVGGWRVVNGHATPGDIVQFAYLFSLLAFPLRVLGFLLGDLPRTVAGWDRLRAVLDADEPLMDLESAPSATDVTLPPAELELSGVSFSYDSGARPEAPDRHEVLRDIQFRAAPGRVLALVGPTGSGKSTIASLLVRLIEPQTGDVRVDGRDLREITRSTLSRDAALVFQTSFIFDDTVRENITLGESFTDNEVQAAAALAQADEFVRRLPQGFDTPLGERGATLSGGQRQRIALARALIRKPRLLILDDATSAVDPKVEAAILAGLRNRMAPTTIVVVAYRRATIALADDIVFINDGMVAAQGTHEELMASHAGYRELVTAYDDAGDQA